MKFSVPKKVISGARLIIEDHTSFRQSLTLDGESRFEVMAQKGVLATEDPSSTVCAGPGFWVVI